MILVLCLLMAMYAATAVSYADVGNQDDYDWSDVGNQDDYDWSDSGDWVDAGSDSGDTILNLFSKSRERIEAFDNAVMIGGNDAAAKGRMLDAQAQMFENMGKQQGGVSSNDVAGVGIGMLGLSMGAQQMQNMQAQAMQPGAQMPGFGVAPGQQMPGQPMQGQGMPNQQAAMGAGIGMTGMSGAQMQQTAPSADALQSGAPVEGQPTQPNPPAQADHAPQPQGMAWNCECGVANEGNFCSNCGKSKPAAGPWNCECGTANEGNFCSNCGKPKA